MLHQRFSSHPPVCPPVVEARAPTFVDRNLVDPETKEIQVEAPVHLRPRRPHHLGQQNTSLYHETLVFLAITGSGASCKLTGLWQIIYRYKCD